jgi:hypothetical protein
MTHKYNIGDVILVKRGRYLLEKPIVAAIVELSKTKVNNEYALGYATIFAGKEDGCYYYVAEEDIEKKL